MFKKALGFSLLLICINAFGEEDITAIYHAKIAEYNAAITQGDYSNAKEISLNLLDIDPADTVAALRFAIAAKLAGEKQSELLEELSHYLDQSTLEKKELLDLSKALVKQK